MLLLRGGADKSLARTCFLLASVTRKYLQFDTLTDPSFNDTIDSVLQHQEVGRAKNLSAPLPYTGTTSAASLHEGVDLFRSFHVVK